MKVFIDTQDMEERYGEQLYMDYLKEQNQQLKSTLEEIKIEISALMSRYFYEKDFCIEDTHLDKLLQIIDKGVNNERR